MFPDLLRLAMAVCAAIGHLYADAGYDSVGNRGLCLRQGVQPHIRKIGSLHGSGLGAIRCVVDASSNTSTLGCLPTSASIAEAIAWEKSSMPFWSPRAFL